MRLYLHIGISKTGTSAIQKFLFDYRDHFVRVHRILYPETGILNGQESPAHYFLAFSLYKPQEAQVVSTFLCMKLF